MEKYALTRQPGLSQDTRHVWFDPVCFWWAWNRSKQLMASAQSRPMTLLRVIISAVKVSGCLWPHFGGRKPLILNTFTPPWILTRQTNRIRFMNCAVLVQEPMNCSWGPKYYGQNKQRVRFFKILKAVTHSDDMWHVSCCQRRCLYSLRGFRLTDVTQRIPLSESFYTWPQNILSTPGTQYSAKSFHTQFQKHSR
jgi:hypothetical protein